MELDSNGINSSCFDNMRGRFVWLRKHEERTAGEAVRRLVCCSPSLSPSPSGTRYGRWSRGEYPRPAEAERSGAMRSAMEIDDSGAVIQFDPDIAMFRALVSRICRRVRRPERRRGFLRAGHRGLGREGAASLKVFPEMCEKAGVESRKQFSGKFNVRLPPE